MALLVMVIFTHYTAGRSFPIKFLCNKLKVKLQLMHWRLHTQCLLLNISEEISERKKTTWLCLITVMQVEVAKNSQRGLQGETQKLHFTLPYKVVSEYKELQSIV